MTTTATNRVAVADGIFRLDGDTPVLLGSRCTNCDNHMFPRQQGCPKCMMGEQVDIELGTTGTLWAWTIQAFPPKAPPYLGPTGDDFVPYGVGYVELPGEVRVEARLTENDPDRLVIGMEMETVVHELCTDDDGNTVVTYAFAPTSTGTNEQGDQS